MEKDMYCLGLFLSYVTPFTAAELWWPLSLISDQLIAAPVSPGPVESSPAYGVAIAPH